MRYDEIDWEAEAQHLTTAFGIVGRCCWVSEANFAYSYRVAPVGRVLIGKSASPPLMCSSGDRVKVIYSESDVKFELYRFTEKYCSAYLANNGIAPQIWVYEGADSTPMNRALFYLITHSPAVTAVLNISAHEKIEWLLDFEARFKL